MGKTDVYDIIIPGGGLAGLTLALQLKQSKPDVSILVLERRVEEAPVATHKVGESTSEIGSYYLREVLQLKKYLTEYQLPKRGFRFFFSPENREDIARRVEVGSWIINPFPTHQIDRGPFENKMVARLNQLGVDVVLGATVKDVDLSKEGHTVHYAIEGHVYAKTGRWVIDSTGRRGLLKKKLGLEKESDHVINAAWFRVGCKIDIDQWSEDMAWSMRFEKDHRRLATNHLMGEGYWVWIIPLVSGNTSIGIVADPGIHPFHQFNTLEKAMEWLEKYEPVAAQMLKKEKVEILDFKIIKHFAYDIRQFYSTERWGVTGEAGVFMDPLYSPGTDFIGLNNTWLTELIIRDLQGENIALRTMIYERAHRELINGWFLLYQDMYGLFGKTQIMLMKIAWDWGSYWSIPSLMFMNNGYTDIDVLKRYSATTDSIGSRFSNLNKKMQGLFLAWGKIEHEPCTYKNINVFDLDFLHQFQVGLSRKCGPEELVKRISDNLILLEQIAAAIFQVISMKIHHTPSDMKVDPYQMDILDTREELLEKSKGPHALGVVESIKADVARIWLSSVKTIESEYA